MIDMTRSFSDIPMRILIAFDGSVGAYTAIERACKLTSKTSLLIRLVYVVDRNKMRIDVTSDSVVKIDQFKLLRHAKLVLIHRGITSEIVVKDSQGQCVGKVINQEATDWMADLVILGRTGAPRDIASTLGRNAESIIGESQFDSLIVTPIVS